MNLNYWYNDILKFKSGLTISKQKFGTKSDVSTALRPFRILGIQQVAIGSLNKPELTQLWGNILGVEKVGEYKSENENVDEDIYLLPDGVEIDLMQPLDENRSPKVHKPALNHIGLWVDNLEEAVKWLTDKGQGVRFAPGGIRKGASGFDVAFIHPSKSQDTKIGGCGVLIELVQAPSHVIDKYIENQS